MKSYLYLITILILFASFAYSQEFGEISEEELQVTQCKEDPDADAIILFDKGVMHITKNFNLRMTVHVRMKILTEAGKKNADKKISIYYKDDLVDIEAASYSPNGDVFELDDENIFEEDADRIKIYSFAIPGVEIGSVIEYRYEFFSEFINQLEPWYFQSGNYTKLSQLQVLMSQRFAYNSVKKNFEKYEFEEKNEIIRDPEDFGKEIAMFTWTGKNLPAISREPYMDNIDDEYAKIIFYLHSYKGEYEDYNYSRTWDEIGKRIYDDNKKYLEKTISIENKLKEITSSGVDPIKKATDIYNFVKDNIKTDENSVSNSAFKEPEKILENKAGNSDEKNMLLVNMLRTAGFDAKILLISTRSHGEVVKDFPDPSQFNQLICCLKIEDKIFFLNTSSKSVPFGCLVTNMDVPIGLLLDEKSSSIINLKPIQPLNRVEIVTEGKIDEQGSVFAKSEITYKGYNAFVQRDSIENRNELNKYVEKLLKELNKEAKLDSFNYAGIDSINSPLILTVAYTIPNYVLSADNYFYFAPPLFSNISENPFVRSKRTYSICFPYDNYKSEKLKLEYPEGFTVNELPKGGSAELTNYTYRKYYSRGNNYIECTRSTHLKQRIISYKAYTELKEMYNSMISMDQQQIVLSKIPSDSTGGK